MVHARLLALRDQQLTIDSHLLMKRRPSFISTDSATIHRGTCESEDTRVVACVSLRQLRTKKTGWLTHFWLRWDCSSMEGMYSDSPMLDPMRWLKSLLSLLDDKLLLAEHKSIQSIDTQKCETRDQYHCHHLMWWSFEMDSMDRLIYYRDSRRGRWNFGS